MTTSSHHVVTGRLLFDEGHVDCDLSRIGIRVQDRRFDKRHRVSHMADGVGMKIRFLEHLCGILEFRERDFEVLRLVGTDPLLTRLKC